jgi:hypothetical protein
MPRSSPFAGVTDGPADDAVIIELGGPSRSAWGCFGATLLFLAVTSAGALSYAIFGTPGPTIAAGGFRLVTGVIGAVFVALIATLAVAAINAVRDRHGLAFDATAAWSLADGAVVRVPWSDIAAARLVTPATIGYLRTSRPHTTTVELCPFDEATLLRYPALRDKVIAGAPIDGAGGVLRFAFRLPSTEFAPIAQDALRRFAPTQLAAGTSSD